jgi:hypothetical protein
MKIGYNEPSVITNIFLCQIDRFNTQSNPDINNPGCNEQEWPVQSCSLLPS